MAIKIKEKIKVDPENLGLLDDLYDRIEALKEGQYTVYVLDEKPKRSLSQNKYYWGVVIKVLQEFTGYTTSQLHNLFTMEFLSTTMALPGTDKVKTVAKSTTELTTEEFMEYVEQVRMWAIETNGWYIPLPQEVSENGEYEDLYVHAMNLKV